MKKINLDECKKIEAEILKKINIICKENDIKLYLGGGTLLGAARHKGFIPWDDDIDVMLLRDDYNKLLKILDGQIVDGIKLLCYKNNSDYYYPFAKAVDTRTLMDETFMSPINGLGIYIDIFPIDYIPNDFKIIKKVFRKRKIYQSLINFTSFRDVVGLSDSKMIKLCKIIIRPFVKLIPVTFFAKKMDLLLKKYNKFNAENVVCISGAYYQNEIMPKEYIRDSVEVLFEGETYLAPIDYKDYLIKHYGENYMELPPKEKQKTHHTNECYWK